MCSQLWANQLRCQTSHPALVPALVDLIEHRAGGGVSRRMNVTTTYGHHWIRFRCDKHCVSISFQRQKGRGAAVFARVDFSGVDKVWGAACDEKKIVLQWIADKLPGHNHCTKEGSFLSKVVGCLPGGALFHPLLH